MSKLQDWAHHYLAMGLHPIPCAPRSKRPRVEWRRYQVEQPLADEIDTWWSEEPESNVALVLGRGTFAVDLDGGREAERLLVDRGILLPGAPRSRTANGFHVFLSAPGPVPDRVGLLSTGGKKPQVDIRGVGIVVVHPSIHPDGPTYEWEVPLTLPFPPAPDTLLALIQAGVHERPTGAGPGSTWVAEALADGVGEGLRDATCTRLAGYFLGLGVDAATTEALLLESFARNCTPPLDRETVRKCVRSIDRRQAMGGTRAGEAGGPARADLQPVPIAEVLDQLEATQRAGPPRVVRTPFGRLNQILGGGFSPGELVYLGARPGVGKTAMALQMAQAAAADGEAVVVVSREMLNIALARRMIAQVSQVSATDIKRWVLDPQQEGQVRAAVRQLRGLPLWLSDDIVSLAELEAMVAGFPQEIGLVIVDYLQLVRAPKDIRERRLQVEAVSQGLKTLAVTYKVPVLCLSSLSRPGKDQETRKPVLADLRESGELEHDADTVLFLHRKMLERETECLVAKQRDGAVGIVQLLFTSSTLRFDDDVNPGEGF